MTLESNKINTTFDSKARGLGRREIESSNRLLPSIRYLNDMCTDDSKPMIADLRFASRLVDLRAYPTIPIGKVKNIGKAILVVDDLERPAQFHFTDRSSQEYGEGDLGENDLTSINAYMILFATRSMILKNGKDHFYSGPRKVDLSTVD